MLSATTKRKIDNARDVLVGKIPNPQSQVEQITSALIYKFMDDMDEKSKSLGGKARFFTGDYEKYSWRTLLDPRIGGQERFNLYDEALEKLSLNPNIPELFRAIFKGTRLPFKDPETLSLFLKEIDWFDYHHSEELGNAYEYLLNIMGSQGDAGQFRTPRHLINFIVNIVNPTKNETILDPACGTAGFLISAYKHILGANDGLDDITGLPTEKESRLNPEERAKVLKNFTGYDIDPGMVRLSLVNMYLHGFVEPRISEYDSLTYEDHWDDDFDVILANPPFMTPKGGIKPHKRFQVSANRAEVLFVDYIIEHLKPQGRAGIVVPEGVLHNNNKATKQLRKMLLDAGLWCVIELPHGMFKPYASVKTHVLLIDAKRKSDKNVLFVKIVNDGFTQTDARRPIGKNDLPKALDVIRKYENNEELQEDEDLIFDVVSKKTILEEPLLSLVGRRYIAQELAKESNWPSKKLDKSIIKVVKGKSPTEQTGSGEFTFVVTAANKKTADHFDYDEKAICIPLVSSTGHGHASVRRLHYQEGKFALANIMCAIVVLDETVLLPKYLYYILSAKKDELIASLMTGTSNVSMAKDDLYTISIPLPPIEVQQEFVKSVERIEVNIESHQKEIEKQTKTITNKSLEAWGE